MAASRLPPAAKFLSKLPRKKNRFDYGIATELPPAYKKFWNEWKIMKPAAVHYIPETVNWRRNELTGETKRVQNVPIPVTFPKEAHEGIWGGEGVVSGFQQRHWRKRRVSHFWVPVLKRTVVRSEVLNTYLSVTVTDRAIKLIHDHYGFDHYLLKTPACDLVSMLALKLKKQILVELMNGCLRYSNNPEKQKKIYEEYKPYLASYTPEEIDWYGLSWIEALGKLTKLKEAANKPVALKHLYRKNLIEKLKAVEIEHNKKAKDEVSNTSWLAKINPFGKKDEA